MTRTSMRTVTLLCLGVLGCAAARKQTSEVSASERTASQAAATASPSASPGASLVGRDHGVCVTGLSSIDEARRWAASFQLPGAMPIKPLELKMTEIEGVLLGDLRIGGWVQSVRYPPGGGQRRVFVTVEKNGVQACLVAERRIASNEHPIVAAPLTDDIEGGFAVRLREGARALLDVRCRLDDGLGCLSVAPLDDHRWVAGRLRYRPKPSKRASIPIVSGSSRWLEGEDERPLRGRSARWRREHPDAVAPPLAPRSIAWLSDEAQKSSAGHITSHGRCFSAAADWDTAELWALSFRASEGHGKNAPLSEALERVPMSTHDVRLYRQRRHFRMDEMVRYFAMVPTTGGEITGCLITEDLLTHGYLQAPTPIPHSLERWGDDGFRYRAIHQWHNAVASPEEAQWEIRCRVLADELGCIAATTTWIVQRYDETTKTDRPVEHRALLRWTDDRLTFESRGKTMSAKLVGGQSTTIAMGTIAKPSGAPTLP